MTQKGKDMGSKEFKQLKEELSTGVKWQIYQRRPVTVVIATVYYGGVCYQDFGYSKVTWPDWWNRQRGVEIAKGKAVDNVARRIMGMEVERLDTLETFTSASIGSYFYPSTTQDISNTSA